MSSHLQTPPALPVVNQRRTPQPPPLVVAEPVDAATPDAGSAVLRVVRFVFIVAVIVAVKLAVRAAFR